MAAHLACSLAIADGKRPVDLRPSKGLRQPEVFMLGKLLTAREYNRRSLLGMFRSAWRINGSLRVEDIGEDDRILFSFSDPADRGRVWKGGPWGFNRASIALADYEGVRQIAEVPLKTFSYWITLLGVPPAFLSEPIMRLIGSTLGEFMKFDRSSFRTRVLRIHVEIEFANPLLFKRRFWVEDNVRFLVRFKFDKIFGRCGYVTHVGLPCSGLDLQEDEDEMVGTEAQPSALAALRKDSSSSSITVRVLAAGQTLVFKAQVPRSIPEAFLPQSVMASRRAKRQIQIRELETPCQDGEPITGKRRDRAEEEITISPKKLRLSLAIGKKNLDAMTMGLLKPPITTGEPSKRKRGRPVGNLNKLPYGTAGKGKNGKTDAEKKSNGKCKKTNLLPRLLAAEDGVKSNPKGKELALV